MIDDLSPEQIQEAVMVIAQAVANSCRPNTAICEKDGCLIRVGRRCPACDARAMPRTCDCKCGCSIRIRCFDETRCSRCRRSCNDTPQEETRSPAGWVRRGLIMRPVYTSRSEVA